MKTIPLNEAVAILEKARYVEIDGVLANLYIDKEDKNQEFLGLSDTDGEVELGTFREAENKDVAVRGAIMYLADNCGQERQLTLLIPHNFD